MESRDKQDGIRSWCQLVQQSEIDGNRNVRIKRLESVINTVFHHNYEVVLVNWIQDFEVAFTELALLGQKTWNDDEIKMHGFVQNDQNIGLIDTDFKELVSNKSFIETCNFLRSHAIRLYQQYKEKAARQIHNASQSSNRSKKDKVKKVLALINEIKIQDSCSSDEELATVSLTNTAMVCLAQVPHKIWMNLPLEANK
jgi:predicted aspartyl protease